MKRLLAVLAVLALGCVLLATSRLPYPALHAAEKEGRQMLSHNVYFSLKESNEANRQALVDACKKYLAKHPGTVFFAAGVVGEEFDRPVNDRDFDVALCLVFDSLASHDAYQSSPLHLKFIDENRDTWEKVRVFDAYVEP